MALVQMGYAISGINESIENLPSIIGTKLLIVDERNQELNSLSFEINIPIIKLIAPDKFNADSVNNNKIAYLTPPFTKARIKPLLDHLIANIDEPSTKEEISTIPKDTPLKLNDRIFVRHKEKMVKLEIENILYIEADRNYSRIFSKGKEYMVATTLKAMESKLPDSTFFRIHRSYIVNLRQIDEVAETHLVIARKALPISKSLRAGLMKRLKTI